MVGTPHAGRASPFWAVRLAIKRRLWALKGRSTSDTCSTSAWGHRAPRVRFEQKLEDYPTDGTADETLDAVVDWDRYAEIFAYED